jgi:hypothetical protein
MKEKLSTLSWTQCKAIINHYQPSEEKISEIFGIPSKQVRNLDIFNPDPSFDVTPYYLLFDSEITSTTNSSGHGRVDTYISKSKKPRGRPGNRIITAFQNIPETPIDVKAFASKWQVSVSVLRQSLRFDKTGLPGKVHVRLNKENILVIWRDNK